MTGATETELFGMEIPTFGTGVMIMLSLATLIVFKRLGPLSRNARIQASSMIAGTPPVDLADIELALRKNGNQTLPDKLRSSLQDPSDSSLLDDENIITFARDILDEIDDFLAHHSIQVDEN